MPTISKAALEARIRRALKKEGQRLSYPRNAADQARYGYTVIDNERNCVIASNCDLQTLARELNVLAAGDQPGEAA